MNPSSLCSHNTSEQILEDIYYCEKCSSFLLLDKNVYTMKLDSYIDNDINYNFNYIKNILAQQKIVFANKKDYIQIRKQIIKNLKTLCDLYKTGEKIYYLAMAYLDRAVSKFNTINYEIINHICLICLLLAIKFNGNLVDSFFITKEIIKQFNIKNYQKDELFVLSLLNYELNIPTLYEVKETIKYIGFIFNNENVSYKKLNNYYKNIDLALYLFTEHKYFLNLNYVEIILSFIYYLRTSFYITIEHVKFLNLCKYYNIEEENLIKGSLIFKRVFCLESKPIINNKNKKLEARTRENSLEEL